MGANRVGEVALEAPEALRRRRRALRFLLRFLRTKPLGAIGGLLILVMVLTALLAPVLAPYDPNEAYYDSLFARPGAKYLLGTDNFGRDILSRIILGSRISLYVGLVSIGVGTTLGALLGLVSGFWGRTTDAVIQRLMDILMAFPALVLAMAVVAALGPSVNNVIIAIAVTQVPRVARVLRSSALSVKQTQYVDAARSIGCGDWRVLFRHVAPNCVAPYIILATAGLGIAILTEASLSFLGLGPPPPNPTWGAMLTGASRQYLQKAPWMAIYPGLAITLAVFGFNLLGDAIRDVLDPRLRGR